MALKLDKDALLEFIGKNKDQLFLGVLVITAAYGGWYLYNTSSRSVDQIISDYIQGSSGTGGADNEDVSVTEVAEKLTSKEDQKAFELDNNPFGSPEDQLKIRQQVESYYKQGVELYDAQRFQEAIAMFDRVIELDVTETRIRYPISPSEYKRRAQSQDATLNFDRILTTAKTEASEGDRLSAANQKTEALNAYDRSSKLVSDVLDSSPELPQEKLDQLREVQVAVDQKLRTIQKEMITLDVGKAAQEAQSVLQSNDLVLHIQSSFRLAQIQIQINQIDPNAQLIEQSIRSNVEGLQQRLQANLKDKVPMIISQAETQFMTALQNKDTQKTQQAIFALTQAVNYVQQNQDASVRQEIIAKRNGFIAQRAQLVLEKAQEYLQAQTQILAQSKYESFDQQSKFRFLADLNQLLESGGNALQSDMQQTIRNVMSQINALKLPPPVTESIQIISIKQAGTSKSYSVQYLDLSSRNQKPRNGTWREGSADRQTSITMKVDTDRGVVILSKPGYTNAEVPLTSSN